MLGADQRYKYAKDDGQFGFAARTYIDDIGTVIVSCFGHKHTKLGCTTALWAAELCINNDLFRSFWKIDFDHIFT